MSLAELIRGTNAPDKFATATPATSATATPPTGESVAIVATVAVATLNAGFVGQLVSPNPAADWSQLEAAIHACCDARGDSPENRAALLADCREEPATNWPWLAQHFNGEAILFGARATLANAMAQGANDD